MKKYMALICALVAFLGVGLGAVINYYASQSLDSESRSREIRLEAYSDFVVAQAKNDIRASTLRVALFSPVKVASAFSEWLASTREDTCQIDNLHEVLKLHHMMRNDSFLGDPAEELSDRNMSLLTLGCFPPNQN